MFGFVKAHARPRPRPLARFRGTNDGVLLRRVGSYEFPPVPGRSWERWLNADMIALPAGGTVVIARAGDAWIHTPHRVLLPRGVRRVDVLSRLGKGSPNVLVHVSRRYDVASIVALQRAGPVRRRARGLCLGFRHRTDGHAQIPGRERQAARARHRPRHVGGGGSGPCNPFQVTVRGRAAPPLIGGLLLQVQHLLGVDLAPPVPREVASCLSRHGWQTRLGCGALLSTSRERWGVRRPRSITTWGHLVPADDYVRRLLDGYDAAVAKEGMG